MIRNLASGGYVKLLEVDGFLISDDDTLSEDHALKDIYDGDGPYRS